MIAACLNGWKKAICQFFFEKHSQEEKRLNGSKRKKSVECDTAEILQRKAEASNLQDDQLFLYISSHQELQVNLGIRFSNYVSTADSLLVVK